MTDIVEEMARSINAIAGEYRIAWSTAVADRMAKAAYTIVERRIGELRDEAWLNGFRYGSGLYSSSRPPSAEEDGLARYRASLEQRSDQ